MDASFLTDGGTVSDGGSIIAVSVAAHAISAVASSGPGMYETIREFMRHDMMGMPVYVWTIAAALGLLNEIVLRSQWTEAKSILQGLGRFVLRFPFFGPTLMRFPLIGYMLARIAGMEPAPSLADAASPAPVDPTPAAPPSERKDSGKVNVLVLLAIVAVSILVSCATALENAKLTRGAVAKAMTETTLAWIRYDHDHQMAIVNSATTREEAEAKLSDYRTKIQAPVLKAFYTVEGAVKELGNAINAAEAIGNGKSVDWGKLVSAVLAAANDLSSVLKTYGVNVPIPKFGFKTVGFDEAKVVYNVYGGGFRLGTLYTLAGRGGVL